MNQPFEWRAAPKADFAVIGDPVKHSLSPKMHSAAYAALSLDLSYVAIHVSTGEVELALNHLGALGYQGVNVTVPHKEEVLNWARSPDEFALKARAANTIRMADRSAINTDAPGFLDTIEGRAPTGSRVLMIGAGGSARALAIALVLKGYSVQIHNRTRERAVELARVTGASVIESLDPADCDLIVNTTSASLSGADLPVNWDNAKPGAIAYDLAYAPQKTPFMLTAEAHGLKAMDGRELLVAQGARSFEWWLGRTAPRDAMLVALL